jgi:hypothetical protein
VTKLTDQRNVQACLLVQKDKEEKQRMSKIDNLVQSTKHKNKNIFALSEILSKCILSGGHLHVTQHIFGLQNKHSTKKTK